MPDQPELFAPSTGPGGGPLRLPLRDADPLLLWRGWAIGRTEGLLLERLTHAIPWESRSITMHGKTFPVPRLERWFADEAGATYTYSSRTYLALAMSSIQGLRELRDHVEATTGITGFDAVFVNLYRSGRDSIDWHADAEPVLGPIEDIVIASVSLGERRRFSVRRKADGTSSGGHVAPDSVDVDLGCGDLLLMGRHVQARYEHQAPKTARPVGPRMNLTFRRLRARGGP